MFRRSSETHKDTSYHVVSKHTYDAHGLQSRSPLTFYVLSNEGVVHYVTVIRFQDFLKFSDVIVLVGAAEEQQLLFLHHIQCVSVTRNTTHPDNRPTHFKVFHFFLNTILITVWDVRC